jgi:hypothetical protein
MVGGNQFNLQQRESMLREIAAAKTRGWRLIILGFVLYFVGGGLITSGGLRFIAQAAGGTGRNPGSENVMGGSRNVAWYR